MANNVDQYQNLGAASLANAQGVAERNVASENTLNLLRNDIGKPGTYGPTAGGTSTPAPPNPNSGGPSAPIPDGILNRGSLNFKDKATKKRYDTLIKKGYTTAEAQQTLGGAVQDTSVSLFKDTGTAGMGGGMSTTSGGAVGNSFKLDPKQAAASLESSSAFRQVSQMMAESEQLLSRSGPLYDEMIRSTQLPILESAAASQRDSVENIRTAMAKGGSARRDAFAAVQKMRAQDSINMQKGMALAQAHMDLDMWTRKNAKETINFSDSWSANSAGIRDVFGKAMDNAANLMGSTALPFTFGTTQQEQATRDKNSSAARNKVNNWITSSVGLVVGAVGAMYGGSGQAMQGFGHIGDAGVGDTGVHMTSTGTLGGDVKAAGNAVVNDVKGAYNYVTGGWGSDTPTDSSALKTAETGMTAFGAGL